MKKELLINGGALNAPVFSALAAEQFLTENYSFRRNQLNGKVEFATKSPDGQASDYRPLTQEALNSIILRAKREDICEGSNPNIPQGQYIDNSGEIDYDQLYAQVVYELREQKAPYWFNNDEVARIQQLNQEFMEQKDIVEIIKVCFRKPMEDEHVTPMNASELIAYIQSLYPSFPDNISTRVRLGKAMKLLGYDSNSHGHACYFRAVPVKQTAKICKAA